MSDYRPYTKEQWVRIKQMWDLYKESVGLEGDISLKLVREGKSPTEVDNAIEEHRNNVRGNLETWHSLRKEAQ
jgi:hypothetical protein